MNSATRVLRYERAVSSRVARSPIRWCAFSLSVVQDELGGVFPPGMRQLKEPTTPVSSSSSSSSSSSVFERTLAGGTGESPTTAGHAVSISRETPGKCPWRGSFLTPAPPFSCGRVFAPKSPFQQRLERTRKTTCPNIFISEGSMWT